MTLKPFSQESISELGVDKDGHYVINKGDKMIINRYVPNATAQTNTISSKRRNRVQYNNKRDFNTSHQSVSRSSRQKF
jgi:hypothetical protein